LDHFVNIAFVTYETSFAPCGGIAAVMARLPAKVQAVSRVETIVITPFHHRIEKMASLGRSHEGSFGVSIADRTVVVHVYRHDDKIPYYFLLPEDKRYFAGERHPYDVSGDDLLRDSIVYLTCLHELGHALGLEHTRDFRDIMYYFGYGGDIVEFFERYRRQIHGRKDIAAVPGLSEADVKRIRALYAQDHAPD